jgi:hypothetical protein
MFRCTTYVFAGALCGLSCATAYGQDPTNSLLTAKRVDGVVVIRLLDEGGQKLAKVPFEYRIGNEPYRPLTSGHVFRASDAFRIEYDQPNPLVVQLSVSETQTEDPNNAALGKFIEKLVAFPTVVGGKQSATLSPCKPLQDVFTKLDALRAALFIGNNNSTHLRNWRKAVDDKPGRPGILDARAAVSGRLEELKTAHEKAAALIKELETIATLKDVAARSVQPSGLALRRVPINGMRIMLAAQTVAPTPGTGARSPAVPAAPSAKPQPAGKKPTDPQPEGATAPTTGCGSPAELARALAQIVDIGNAREDLKNLEVMIESVDGIYKALEPYASASRWTGPNFLLYVVMPSPEQVKTISVAGAEIKYEVGATGTITQTLGSAQTAKFDVRDGGSLVAELGAGLIISPVLTPDYGTTTDANGQLIVAPPTHKSASFSAALMMNAVCRCGMKPSFLYPMFQFGVSTDGTSPALLFGGGVRFTRPKRVALSGGVLLAWIKDLNALSVGSPVKGTSDITNDLRYRNDVKPYFALLYNF